jgi:hypothetical protein
MDQSKQEIYIHKECYMLQLLFTASVVPGSPILFTPMIEGIRSSEWVVLTNATWRHITEDGILHSYLREDLKSHV